MANILYEHYPYSISISGLNLYNYLLNLNLFLYFFYYIMTIDLVNSTFFYTKFPVSQYNFNTFYDVKFFIIYNLFFIMFFIAMAITVKYGRAVVRRKGNE
ncbi:MAG: hypothetical protein ACK4NF_06495 [Planctomycetota bacterium]